MTKTTPSYPGLQYILDLILEQFDPQGTPRSKTKDSARSKPGTLSLKSNMETETKHLVQSMMRPAVQNIFSIHPNSITTLRSLDLPSNTLDFVLSLNYLAMLKANHAINDRLKTIATLPQTPPGQNAPDWTQWWFNYRDSYIGIARPQDHDPVKDPVSELLNTVITAMAARSQPHIPDHPAIARHLATNPPTNSRHKPILPLTLSHIYGAASDIHTLAFRLRLDPAHAAKVLPITDPDTILSTLLNKGINVLRDMGTITTLEELKPFLQEEGSQQIYADGHWAIWTHKKAYQHYKLSPTRHIYSFPIWETTIAFNEKTEQNLSQEELKGNVSPDYPTRQPKFRIETQPRILNESPQSRRPDSALHPEKLRTLHT